MVKKQKLFLKKGFSLVELVVYLGILGLSVGVFTSVLTTVTTTQVSESEKNELSGQLTFASWSIQNLIKQAALVDMEAGVATSTLKLVMSDENISPTLVYASDGKVYVKKGDAPPQSLTTDDVRVDMLEFRKKSESERGSVISIDLTLSKYSQIENERLVRTLRSSVSRTTAATFDSNLLPPSGGTYDIGSPDAKWRHGYFSGTVSAGEFCILGDCITSWGVGGGLSGTGSAGYLAKWNTTDSLTSSDIYNTGGLIGIGNLNPQTTLHVTAGDSSYAPTNVSGLFVENASSSDTTYVLQTASVGGGRSFSVTGGGKVGIGTDSVDSNYTLTVSSGGIKADSTTQPAGYFSSSSGYGLLVGSGSVGIGTSNPQYLLDVAGEGRFTGPVSVASPISESDAATKAYVDAQSGGSTLLYWKVQKTPLNYSGDLGGYGGYLDKCQAAFGTDSIPFGNSIMHQTSVPIVYDFPDSGWAWWDGSAYINNNFSTLQHYPIYSGYVAAPVGSGLGARNCNGWTADTPNTQGAITGWGTTANCDRTLPITCATPYYAQ